MQLLIFLAGGLVLLAIGYYYRRKRLRRLDLQDSVNLVFIAFGVALAFSEGVLPSIWVAVSFGIAQISGQPTDDLRPHLFPGTNLSEMVRAMVIGTLISTMFAVKAYIDVCRGVRSKR